MKVPVARHLYQLGIVSLFILIILEYLVVPPCGLHLHSPDANESEVKGLPLVAGSEFPESFVQTMSAIPGRFSTSFPPLSL